MNDKPLPVPEVQEIKLGINQWENELFASVSNPATFEKMWNQIPTVRQYEMPRKQQP